MLIGFGYLKQSNLFVNIINFRSPDQSILHFKDMKRGRKSYVSFLARQPSMILLNIKIGVAGKKEMITRFGNCSIYMWASQFFWRGVDGSSTRRGQLKLASTAAGAVCRSFVLRWLRHRSFIWHSYKDLLTEFQVLKVTITVLGNSDNTCYRKVTGFHRQKNFRSRS